MVAPRRGRGELLVVRVRQNQDGNEVEAGGLVREGPAGACLERRGLRFSLMHLTCIMRHVSTGPFADLVSAYFTK